MHILFFLSFLLPMFLFLFLFILFFFSFSISPFLSFLHSLRLSVLLLFFSFLFLFFISLLLPLWFFLNLSPLFLFCPFLSFFENAAIQRQIQVLMAVSIKNTVLSFAILRRVVQQTLQTFADVSEERTTPRFGFEEQAKKAASYIYKPIRHNLQEGGRYTSSFRVNLCPGTSWRRMFSFTPLHPQNKISNRTSMEAMMKGKENHQQPVENKNLISYFANKRH